MKSIILLTLFVCQICLYSIIASEDELTGSSEPPVEIDNDSFEKLPTILIVTLFRNKAYTLPSFFTFLDRLDYPKKRITFWFRSDHNEDNTVQVLHTWLYMNARHYHHIDIEYKDDEVKRPSEESPTNWPDERHVDVTAMKEEALEYARKMWADYVFFLDADAFLVKPDILQTLIALKKPIVAPMLLSDGLYSNFWCGMTSDYYYQRTREYKKIYSYEQRGVFNVPMVHSAVLINLNDKRTDLLTFNKTILSEHFSLTDEKQQRIPTDDIIVFALSANFSNVPVYIVNEELYGYVTVPLDTEDDLKKDFDQMVNTKVLILNDWGVRAVTVDPDMERFVSYPEPDTLSVDAIFMINLERRPERRINMERSFKELGLKVELVAAIDGQKLTDQYLEEIGVRFLPGYADPYHNRPMTLGEIGCFLSHFWIWEKIVTEKLNEVLILEDDIRFEPFFKERATSLLKEAREIGGWDLIYFGRKRLESQQEKWVKNSDHLVVAGYSYWTLGYVITLEGAKKLLDARPLENLIPVDEFLPVMFDMHSNDTWKDAFKTRNLVAWSAAPLMLFPTRYTGEDGYISDTEESVLVTEKVGANKVEKKGKKENLEGLSTTSDDIEDSGILTPPETAPIDTSFIHDAVNEQIILKQGHHSEL